MSELVHFMINFEQELMKFCQNFLICAPRACKSISKGALATKGGGIKWGT